MNILQKFSATSITLAAVLAISVTPVAAESMQQQRQSVSSETSFTTTCSGSNCAGKHEFNSSTSVKQEQRQGSGAGMHGWSEWGTGDNNGWGNWHDEEEVTTDGEVKLTWGLRDGTCHIQYRRVGQTGWPHATATSCNNGEVTIGGLEEGKNYQFRIKKNDGHWSRPLTRRAQ